MSTATIDDHVSECRTTDKASLRVVLASASSGSRGGGELYLCGLAQGLAALGHEVHSVLSEHDRMDELAALLKAHGPVHRIRYKNTYDRRLRSVGAMYDRRGITRIGRALASLHPHVVHINKQNLEDGLDLMLAAQRAKLPTVATVHITRTMRQLGAAGGGLRDWASKRTLRGTDYPLIATAESSMSDLTALGIPDHRLNLVLNGVAPAPVADREAVRYSWGCEPGDVVLGCVARIEHQKNPLFMIPLLKELPPNVRLVWIGDGSLMEPMREAASSAGVGDRLILAGWQKNPRAYMAGFDVFVLPSLYEGFPFALLEAMAAGLPCVVSNVDGVSEAVDYGRSGYLCAPNAKHDWLARLGHYVANPEARIVAGMLGHERYVENFSLEAMAAKTVGVYMKVAELPACFAGCRVS